MMKSMLRELAARECEQMSFNEDCKTYWGRTGDHRINKIEHPWCLPCRAKRYLKMNKLLDDVKASIYDAPVEDGVEHPATGIILAARNEGLPPEGLVTLLVDAMKVEPSLASDVLHCISRLDYATVEPVAKTLVMLGLADPSIAVRESAIRCVEQWELPELGKLLMYEEQAPWLDRYRLAVIGDLFGI